MRAKKLRNNCPICLTAVYNIRSTYCSNSCQQEQRRRQYIERWLNGLESGHNVRGDLSEHVRSWIKNKYGNKCQKCGWSEINLATGNIPVQINHIDGHFKNCSESNLELICPNCHSLTANFGALNRGNGRGYRRKYGLVV